MPAPPDKAKSIFLNALEIASPEDRRSYLDAECGDAALHGEVEQLLRHHGQMGDFLQSPAAGLAVAEALAAESERPGTVIGRYKLLEEIGEGGMGVVYMAEQREPVRRKVALKIIKPGMDTREVIARFEAERQALAMMNHPNIAKVLDGGATESGRPYFVMDLVQGIPVTEYCDRANLTTRQRLALFVLVCQAVQHAHQKGIIHRDVKPSNVMVTLHDGVPVPKIIDFGIAKATSGQLTEKSLFTGHGRMMGTPMYMSPEQAEMSGLDVDTRSDIYSLGVMLYELLTGGTPFDQERVQKASYDEIRRVIREEEPPRPSARISTLGEAGATVSALRKTEPARLSRLVRGDLDWIVMKALEKDPARRYQTANDLARDIQRHLADEPVEARPPTLLDRAARWSRRHKPVVRSMTTVVAITAVVCALLVWNGYRQAVQLERDVGERLAAAQALLASGDYSGADRELAVARGRLDLAGYGEGPLVEEATRLGDDLSARTQAVSRFDQFQKLRHRIHSEMYAVDRRILDQAQEHARTALDLFGVFGAGPWKSQPDFQNLDAERRAVLEDGATEFLFICGRLEIARSDQQPPAERAAGHRRAVDAFSRIETFDAPIPAVYLWIADSWEAVGDTKAAAETRSRADALRPTTAMHYFLLGEHHAQHKRPDQAVASYWQALAHQPDHYLSVLASGVALGELKRYEAAEAMLTGAIAMYPQTTLAYVKRADARWELGKIALALADLEKAKKLDPKLARALTQRGAAYRANLDLEKALADLDEAIRLDPTSSDIYAYRAMAYDASIYAYGTWPYHALGTRDKALADSNEAIRLDPKSAFAYAVRAGVHRMRGDLDKAVADVNEALRLDANSPHAISESGRTYASLGDWDKAIAAFTRLPPCPGAYAERASIYVAKGEFEKALADFEQAGELGPAHWYLYKRRAVAHFRLKQYDKALASIAKAVELNPNDSSNLIWLGPADVAKCPDERLRKGLLELADKTIQLTKRKAAAYAARARLYSAFGEPEKALADFDKGVELEPKNPSAWSSRARFLAERGQWQKATANLEKAIELQPDDPQCCNNLAWLLVTCPERRIWNPARAVELAKKATQGEPGNAAYWNTLGVAQYRAGDYEAAIKTLGKSMELGSGGVAFDWFFLAMAHWQLKHTEEARRWYDKGTAWMEKNKPDDEELLRFRAEATDLLGITAKPPAGKEKTEKAK